MGATSHRPVPFFRANLVPRATLASHLSRAQLVGPKQRGGLCRELAA
jgi:hypothetical protein